MKSFVKFKREGQINNIFNVKQQKKYWMNIFQRIYDDKINSWGYVWVYTCFINNGLCIMPNKNLVSNIGFDSGSTHTKDKTSVFSKLETQEIIEIIHPTFILSDQEADLLTSKIFFGNINIFE